MRPSRTAVVMTLLIALALSLRADAVSGQQRLRRSIEGPVTRDAVTRSLAVVPSNASDPGGPAEVSLMLRIEFAFDSAELTVRAMRNLDGVASALNDPTLTTAQLTLEGHTDATGPEDYNLRLSERRAEAVVTYLAGRGVARARLRAVGFGADRLLPAYPPTDDRQRRVEIVRTF
ncbi:MAG: OmpA family protein [Acidobacteria bacterium]|nr:OmpA family protein [Acidobacteriota bacterium]